MAMPQCRINVECYAGARADERPRRILIEGREFRVTRLISESVDESADSRERIHRYRVLTDAGIVFEVVHKSDGWYLDSESLAGCD